MSEKELDLIREGKIPIRFGADGLPEAAHEPIYELMRFISALAKGYMRLFNAKKIYEKTQGVRR